MVSPAIIWATAMPDIRETPTDILIFTADPRSANALVDGLAMSGLTIQLTTSVETVIATVATNAPAALLMLPRRLWAPEGIESLRRLRSLNPLPCIIRAAPDDGAHERVSALEAGADEVLPSGMLVSEAVARIHALLRRVRGTGASAAWRLVATGCLLESPHGDAQRLTSAEFALVSMLAAAAGEALGRDAISEHVFRRPWRPDDRAVDSLVKRVRRKLPPDAIQSVRSVGYALTIAIETMALHVQNCAPHTLSTSLALSTTYSGVAPVDATKHPLGKG